LKRLERVKSPIGAGEVLNGSELPYIDQRENRGARKVLAEMLDVSLDVFGPPLIRRLAFAGSKLEYDCEPRGLFAMDD
jgi:hypothetical protein